MQVFGYSCGWISLGRVARKGHEGHKMAVWDAEEVE